MLIILFYLPQLLQNLHKSLITQLHVCPLSPTQVRSDNQNKQKTNKTKKPKQNKKHTHTHTQSLFCINQLFLGIGAALEYD